MKNGDSLNRSKAPGPGMSCATRTVTEVCQAMEDLPGGEASLQSGWPAQLAHPDSQQVGCPKPNPSGPTCKRKRGRRPQARLTMTPCETSGYNTGPGRCSDPSCLVLQPEGRRSAAEPLRRLGTGAEEPRGDAGKASWRKIVSSWERGSEEYLQPSQFLLPDDCSHPPGARLHVLSGEVMAQSFSSPGMS
ncbi:uncharacterized protein LOC117011676 [Rhinolophus ferrumequinum]|uniref:uncharacterized protein LOC117011676 n=1 Tax=Rhinolophus ferrumequinum TaxID=59479 RepID=UPI00140FDC2E|nr:uncharacterized protein LOC117011676 [Rhinolophus ferrumequinum]